MSGTSRVNQVLSGIEAVLVEGSEAIELYGFSTTGSLPFKIYGACATNIFPANTDSSALEQ